MKQPSSLPIRNWSMMLVASFATTLAAHGQDQAKRSSSYAPVDIKEDFATIQARMEAAKAEIEARQQKLLSGAIRPEQSARSQRHDDQAASRFKKECGLCSPPARPGTRWQPSPPKKSATRDLFPKGFLPLPHVNHPEGGMVFPKFHIDEIKKQEDRDLTRFDLDFDLPDHFLPEFPAPIFLTTRPDLGDVSKGKEVTLENYYELFNGILNPKQLEGLTPAFDAVSAAAVQRHRRPSQRAEQPRRCLFRLPRQRTHQRRRAPGR